MNCVLFRREEQHKKEAEIDTNLSQLPCKDDVSRYLFYYRALNRRHTQRFQDASLWKMPTIAGQTMDEIDAEQNFVLTTVQGSGTDCEKCAHIRAHVTKKEQELAAEIANSR